MLFVDKMWKYLSIDIKEHLVTFFKDSLEKKKDL